MRHRVTQNFDTASSFIGDVGFIGVNMRLEPHALQPGFASDAVNMRFRNGIAETRKGFVKLPWMNKISATTITISSITRSGSTATATTATNHPLATNSIATISGAAQPEYNGSFIVTVTGATTFTYTVSGAPATPATGTPVLKKFDQQPWGTVYGIGSFSDPVTATNYTLIASDGSVYASIENREPFSLPLPAGVTVTTNSTFRQAFDTVVLFRGADNAPLAMSSIVSGFASISETPTIITRVDTVATVTMPQAHGFFSGDSVLITGADQAEYNGSQTVAVTSETTFTYTVTGTAPSPATGSIRVNTDGTEPIPNAERGLFVNNRLVIPNDRDELAVSDFGSYTKYLPVVSELRINVGSSDALVSVEKFNDTTIIAFKDHSVYALLNFYADLGALQLDQITDKFGLVAPESVAHCGSDLLFLSQMGVMTIRQTEQNKLQGVTVPLSDPIQPLIDRINWKYAGTAVGAYWDNKYYLAVPLDDAEILEDEFIATSVTAHGGTFVVAPLTVGKTYRYTKGTESSLTHNAVTYTSGTDFVATATTATLNGIPLNETISGSVKQVYKGVNNAVLVYDFLNQAWSGYDEASRFSVKKFHISKSRGLDRLFAVTHQGWIVLYEEDFQDQITAPYTDLEVAAVPNLGVDTIIVNGGTTITAFNSNSNQPDPLNTWGSGGGSPEQNLAAGRTNLYTDTTLTAGYYAGGTPAWLVPSAPNTRVTQITNGVRFHATNGVLPVVSTTGAWATITENVTQEINSRLTTRAFAPEGGESLSDFDWLCLDVQTWKPNYSIELITDGPYETKVIAPSITKSRSEYTMFGRPDYDITNANLDHATDHREDYAVLLGTGEDHAASFKLDSSSADVGRHQEFREQFKIRKRGRSARVNINSTQGRFRLMSVKLENRKAQTKQGART